ncbi:transcription factor IIIB 90 kDa subunit [Nematocida minor]|uniref:transcription factor IIIB 90 kDa subunit n=1 Tax=Nematocida minor TaxID=1912983 RepID=UPI0022208BF8|nr:transcription factor IIIB 90 kDa subunit [Nematocida minor]KAI5192678.1 transcription factor IIIB 90 kDa subunit [Nematocida minor]
MGMKCGICKSSKIETDAARDISYCTSCGLVIEESTIVSDVQFAQDTKGTSVLQGQYVSTGDSKKLVAGKFITTNHISTIKGIAKSIGEALGIGDTQINSAMRWYNLSLQFNFTRGRKTQVLLAACLYITCREEETPHMLVDFAYILRVNVFKIGSVFLKLTRLLNISVPLVDPSLFVPRFCSKLQLPGQVIAKTSLRLIARMDRDWIVIGRKPAGICGAAILIASRIHGNERSVEEVAAAVKVCESTINKRLAEIKETATAALSISEFNTIWLEKEEDPPIVKLRGKVFTESFAKNRQSYEKENDEEISCKPEYPEREDITPLTPMSIASQTTEDIPHEESDLSDEEMEIEDELFLTKEEIKEKERLWDAMHADFLIERKKREVKPKPKPKKQKPKNLPLHDAVESTVKTKHLSTRINYAAIKSLFQR